MKRTAKQILSIFLSLVVVLSSLTLVAFAEDSVCTCGSAYENGFCTNADCGAYEPAVETTDKYDVDLDLTKDVVYEISNAGQLYWFAEQVNGGNNQINGVLKNDIVINENVLVDGKLNDDKTVVDSFRVWTSIGNTTYRYEGVFDGQNHTVSGLYIYTEKISAEGLFGRAKKATIKNVGVIDNYIYAHSQFGGVLGAATDSTTILGCYNEGIVTGDNSEASSAGGVVGDLYSGTVINCYNLGEVNGYDRIGGVVGDSEGTIENCYNLGTVHGGYMTGGVCGIVGYTNDEAIITNCYNKGNVYGNHTTGGVVGYNSGIVIDNYNEGYVNADFCTGGVVGDSAGVATKCYNTGEIKGGSTVGGVFGRAHDDIEDSYNTGNVMGEEGNIGGITGYISSSSMRNCYNTGTIKTTATAYSYFGGIVGEITGGSTLTSGQIIDEMVNCYNLGDVIGTDYTGGVAGWASLLEITDCYNEGDITSSMDATGGVIGCSYSYNIIKNCYNKGEVTTEGYTTGGIVGIANEYSEIIECYNEGNVTSESHNTGGVIGVVGKVASLENCYNVGSIKGAYYVGGVTGKNLGTVENAHSAAIVCATSYYGAGGVAGINSGTISNCYYVRGCATTNLYETTYQKGIGNSETTPLPDVSGVTTAKTIDQFGSGEVCGLLNGMNTGTETAVWKQIIGTDQYPKFEGKTVYYNEEDSSFYNGVISLDFWKEQIRFDKDENGDYAGTFDYRVLATMTSDQLFDVYETQEDARKGIQEIGFIMAKGEDVSNFDYETAKSVALGAENDAYTKVSLYYITTGLDTDKSTSGKGDFVVSCMVEDIPDADKEVYLATVAYMCYKDDNGNLIWEFSPAVHVNNFVELHDKYYSQAFPS